MKLDLASIKKITGNSQEVVVYGFMDCKYLDVSEAFDELKYSRYYINTNAFKCLNYDTNGLPDARPYKALLTSLALENYKRSLNGAPYIYLIFCVAFESAHSSKCLDVTRLAESHGNCRPFASITDKELRRCYRLYSETNPRIQKIVEDTFKFVKVKKDAATKSYLLEEVLPFWQKQTWAEKWKTRIDNHVPSMQKKLYPWRKILSSEIKHLTSQSLFKKTNNLNCTQPELTSSSKTKYTGKVSP